MSRFIVLENVARPHPSLREILGGLRGHHVASAIVSFLFACTGPVALILTVGIAGGLKPAEIASWISVAFGLGGPLTFAMSYLYRQPLAMAWTISGSAIVGAALLKFPYDEIVGAYVVTGVLMLVLGLSGGFRKLMDLMPQPIVMAMVAGLFLKFGVLAIDGFDKAPVVAVASTLGFVLFSVIKPLGRVIPPVLAALAAGAIAIAVIGGFQPREGAGGLFADPIFFVPKFTEAALLDLVLPLAISVLVLQNAQGIAILRMNAHNPPSNTITAVCGAGTVVFGLFGAVCTCLTGPVNAILSATGETRDHYIGALLWAGLAVLFGLFAPGITSLALAVPDAFIYVIGGLAMLRVLQQSLVAAFGGKFTLGAVVCLTITVTELIPEARFALLGVGAPFWGLVFGILTSLLLEPGDFRRPTKLVAPVEEAPAAPGKVERPVPPVPAWALVPAPVQEALDTSALQPPPELQPPTVDEAAPESTTPAPEAAPASATADDAKPELPLELSNPLPAESEEAPANAPPAEAEAAKAPATQEASPTAAPSAAATEEAKPPDTPLELKDPRPAKPADEPAKTSTDEKAATSPPKT